MRPFIQSTPGASQLSPMIQLLPELYTALAKLKYPTPESVDIELSPYLKNVKECLTKHSFHEAITLFAQIAATVSVHFVRDEHYCYFDDMYCPDYSAEYIWRDIKKHIENGEVSEDDVTLFNSFMDELESMECAQDYGTFSPSMWERNLRNYLRLIAK